MKKLLIGLLLISGIAYAKPEVRQFKEKTKQYQVFDIGKDKYAIDMHRLIENLYQIESHSGTLSNKMTRLNGYSQIEKATWKAVVSDKRFRNRLNEISSHYNVPVDKMMSTKYGQLVAARAVLEYKFMDSGHYMKFADKVGNTHDFEWVIYKIFYNSLAGKATYKKWKQEENKINREV